MLYLVSAAIIVFLTSVRAFSFAVWQFRNKNILGGIMVSLLALSAVVLICINL